MKLSQEIAPFFASRADRWRSEGLFCALSGGADSVTLALVMRDLQLPFTALHCNFHLRGAESEGDEAFVRAFCAQHGIPLLVKHFDVEEQCRKTGESIEMAARTLRYAWFAEQGGYVCVAHHADDQAETLLLQLIRGTGLRGLAGMAAERDRVWRPFLTFSRDRVLDFLQQRGAIFVEDSTNSDTHYRRNWVRHELLPLLRAVNPSMANTLSETASHMRQALSVYELGLQAIATQVEDVQLEPHPLWGRDLRRFSVVALQNMGTAGEQWWRELCWQHGFSTDEAQQAWQGREGLWISSKTHQLCRNGAWLELANLDFPLPILRMERLVSSSPFIPSRDPYCATIDAASVDGELYLRTVTVGDRFSPYGMRKGSKLVSDYLTDRHRSRIEKQRALAVCDAQGIVWLVGETIAHRVAVSDSTETVLQLTLQAVKILEEQSEGQ